MNTQVKRNQRGNPAVWFHYELSPLTVIYTERRKPIYHFLTTVSRLVGL